MNGAGGGPSDGDGGVGSAEPQTSIGTRRVLAGVSGTSDCDAEAAEEEEESEEEDEHQEDLEEDEDHAGLDSYRFQLYVQMLMMQQGQGRAAAQAWGDRYVPVRANMLVRGLHTRLQERQEKDADARRKEQVAWVQQQMQQEGVDAIGALALAGLVRSLGKRDERDEENTATASCWICLEGADMGAGEDPLIRGCACRGVAGFAHCSCLVEYASRTSSRGWTQCGICKQEYAGAMKLHVARVCWEEHQTRDAMDPVRITAAANLAQALADSGSDAVTAKLLMAAVHRIDSQCAAEEHAMPEGTGAHIRNVIMRSTNLGMAALAADMGDLRRARHLYGCLVRSRTAHRHARDLSRLELAGLAGLGSVMSELEEPGAGMQLKIALAGQKAVLGDRHPDTLVSLANLGCFCAECEEYPMARSLLESALAGQRRVLGSCHPDSLRTMSNLALLYMDMGEVEEPSAAGSRQRTHATLELLSESVDGLVRALGPGHHTTETVALSAWTVCQELTKEEEEEVQQQQRRRRRQRDDRGAEVSATPAPTPTTRGVAKLSAVLRRCTGRPWLAHATSVANTSPSRCVRPRRRSQHRQVLLSPREAKRRRGTETPAEHPRPRGTPRAAGAQAIDQSAWHEIAS
jgi:hypothetical protein